MSASATPPGLRLPRALVSTALFFFFALAFVAAPYWLVAGSLAERILSLLFTVLLGALWTRLAANDIQIPFAARAWGSAAILLGLLAALNFRALTAAIPWRGDEGYHIAFALNFAKLMPTSWLVAAILGYCALLFVVWRKPRYAAAACAVLVAACVGVYLLRQPPPLEAILRYPFVSRWFQTLAPILLRPLFGLHHEVFYRIVPFLSAVILSWLYARSVYPRSTLPAVLLGLAIATIPSLYYYSSILYLEMPAVVLMFLVCRESDELLSLPLDELTTRPAWYALVLIGFLKETAAAFLLSFVVFRIIIRVKIAWRDAPWKRLVRDELFMAVCTLLPLAVYLFFRKRFGDPRGFLFIPANLLNPELLPVILRSHLEQFGLVYLFFLAGIVLLFSKRLFGKALFLLAAVVSTTLFHLLDAAKYAGYSRFNLFVMPAVLAGSIAFFQFVGTKKKWHLPALSALVLVTNLVISPMNWDGTRKPYWGNYLATTPAEHNYPFREALAWLKENHRPAAIQFAGMGSDYYFDFYFDKLDWHPKYEVIRDSPTNAPSFLVLLQAASKNGVDCVIAIPDGDVADLRQAEGAAERVATERIPQYGPFAPRAIPENNPG